MSDEQDDISTGQVRELSLEEMKLLYPEIRVRASSPSITATEALRRLQEMQHVYNEMMAKSLWASILGYGPGSFSWPDAGVTPPEKATDYAEPICWHEWKEYVGFSDIFDYCVHCELKREKE